MSCACVEKGKDGSTKCSGKEITLVWERAMLEGLVDFSGRRIKVCENHLGNYLTISYFKICE